MKRKEIRIGFLSMVLLVSLVLSACGGTAETTDSSKETASSAVSTTTETSWTAQEKLKTLKAEDITNISYTR